MASSAKISSNIQTLQLLGARAVAVNDILQVPINLGSRESTFFLRNLPSLKNIQFDLSQFERFDNPENMSLDVLNLMCLKMTRPWPRLRLRHPPLLLPSRLQIPPPPNASRYGTV